MEAENQLGSIEQWYRRAMALDQNWRESRREEERLRGREEQGGATTDSATTLSVAEETNTFSAGDNKACSDGRGREDECGGSEEVRTRDGSSS